MLYSRTQVQTGFPRSIADVQRRLAAQHYVADYGLAVSVFLALRLNRPLFLGGGSRCLQCYEGFDVTHAVYEWDYARQLVELGILEASGEIDRRGTRSELYSDTFLIKRPLLQAIHPARTRPAVLPMDEIDRSDEEFERYLFGTSRLQKRVLVKERAARAGSYAPTRASAG